ncbi:MAG: MarR family transcriptional regulator [Burkholderiaceae bacterium]|nr:MarR family transcriptional regulator [Burkholderiaceae bacterium]
MKRFEGRQQRALRAWLELVRAARAFEARIDARMLATFGQHFTRFDLMSQLYRTPDHRLSITELGSRLLSPSNNISRLLDRMQADGLVARAPNTSDRRRLDVVLTTDGAATFERMAGAHADWVTDALAAFDDATLERITGDLRALSAPAGTTAK